jgi:hypothetical protein
VDWAIDRMVPRDDAMWGEIEVSREEYLARLASLRCKFHSVRHRKEQWSLFATRARETFEAMVERGVGEGDLPAGGVTVSGFSTTDMRVDAEFEAMLFAVRSGLDTLARVIGAFLSGHRELKSYRAAVGIVERLHRRCV